MSNLVTQDEFERRFHGEEIRPHVAHQVDVFLASNDYEYYSDFSDHDIKMESFYKKLERLKYAKREKTGTIADADNFPLAEMHKKWKQRDSKGNPNPTRSAKFALGVLYYLFREVRNPKYFLAVIETIEAKKWSHKEYNFQRLYFAKHSVSPPWDDFQTVSARFFLSSMEIREGFRNIWSGEPLGPVEQVPMGRFNLLLGLDETIYVRDLKTEPADPLYVDKKPDVFAALNWRSKLSKLYGRDKQIKRLKNWALDSDMHPKIMLISGPGGVGKSRLAAEVGEFLEKEHGWKFGELPTEIKEGDVLNGRGNGAVIIVDYPEEKIELVEELIVACQNFETYPSPVRIVLASRDNLETWQKRLNDKGLQNIDEEPFELKPYLNKRDGVGVAKEVAEKYAKAIHKPTPKLEGMVEWREKNPTHSLPLMLVAATLHAVLDPQNAFMLTGRELLLELAEFELRRVREYSSNVLKNDTALQKILALSLLTSNGLSKETIFALGEVGFYEGKSGDAFLERIQKTPYWIAKTKDEPSHLLRLQPDRPAAAFLYLALRMDDPSPSLSKWFAMAVTSETSEFGSTLSRISFDLACIDPSASKIFEMTAISSLNISPELVFRFQDLADKTPSVFSSKFTAEICVRLLEKSHDPMRRASLLYNISLRYSEMGLHHEAMEAAEASFEIFQELDPDSVICKIKLGMALSNLSVARFNIGQLDGALTAACGAEEMGQHLVEKYGDLYSSEIANWLVTISNLFANSQLHDESIRLTKKGLDIFGKLSVDDPETFQPKLAAAFGNYANRLAKLNRFEDALVAAQKSESLFENLANKSPEYYLPHYAVSLGNLSNKLFYLDRPSDALAFALKSVSTYQVLVKSRPDTFLSNYSTALISLSQCYISLGQSSEAIIELEKASKYFKQLVLERPGVFDSQLANSKTLLTHALIKSKRWDDAYEISSNAIRQFFPVFSRDPKRNSAVMVQLVFANLQVCQSLGIDPDAVLLSSIEEQLSDSEVNQVLRVGFRNGSKRSVSPVLRCCWVM